MLDKQLIQLIETTSKKLTLQKSIIEKDYYVTRVIHLLSNVENEYFHLVFAGGTCLAKAHKIVKRMSEDVDFKIQAKIATKDFSKTRLLKELKQFRLQIMSILELSDFTLGEIAVRDEGKYLRVELIYPSSFTINTFLRPHILLEFTLSDVRLPTENLFVTTLIEDTLKTIKLLEPISSSCISVNETAIEKWVGLTRRIVAIERKYHYDDPTLIRHIYDLQAMIQSNKINKDFSTLATTIIRYDALQFKNQHLEYFADPYNEIQQSLAILKNKPLWKTRFQDFIDVMVYDKTLIPVYENAIHSLEKITHDVLKNSIGVPMR